MNREIAEKWTDALRSGEYAQCTGALNAPGKGHCCLGVLCELAVEAGVPVETVEVDRRRLDAAPWHVVSYDGMTDVLPARVRDWAEMASSDGELDEYHEAYGGDLALWNDHGATFAEIADAIEAEWETL